ncbi:hypothetical protein ALC57_14954 [Trachymyrmex cornetzi]|uniref:Uncharacterized protein n=1 Tax=Trachymyrmex cornetzi TaxID=471704 RepID=A0A195DK79_9HYME|nr:hypothetical protein ALC57_14954 [Trachymyrmex cornetzi]
MRYNTYPALHIRGINVFTTGGGSDGGVGNSRSLRYEILSRIIEFLQAFSRLAMFLLAGLISEDDSPRVRSSDRPIAQKTRASPARLSNNLVITRVTNGVIQVYELNACLCVDTRALLRRPVGALDQRRGTVIQRTGGQDRRRKSLILNGARTDIARENWK